MFRPERQMITALGLERVHFLINNICALPNAGSKSFFMFQYWSFNRLESIIDCDLLCFFKESLKIIIFLVHQIPHSLRRRYFSHSIFIFFVCCATFYFFHIFTCPVVSFALLLGLLFLLVRPWQDIYIFDWQ